MLPDPWNSRGVGVFSWGPEGWDISAAVSNHDLETKEFGHILIDSLDLRILTCVLLFMAGLIEVYVTPIFL
ncbi:MAG: hypothetical protein DRO89_04900 [Candidatus Altiarchaeales archaeon]|nr:MAG: hypothetical protein DRO89_04900 [Candidatus Altiarchaeales archaeon]